MSPDIQIKNDIAITIHSFETQYRRTAEGQLDEFDVVTYSPQGDTKTIIMREVRKVMKVRSLEECGDNIASLIALKLWQRIEPAYRHWKENNKLPESGTPLGAWPAITPAQANVLKCAGLKSIEEVASASDIVIMKTGLANALGLRDLAQKFLSADSKASDTAKMAKLERDNDELREQLAELMKLMQEMTAPKADEDPPAPAATSSKKKAAA